MLLKRKTILPILAANVSGIVYVLSLVRSLVLRWYQYPNIGEESIIDMASKMRTRRVNINATNVYSVVFVFIG